MMNDGLDKALPPLSAKIVPRLADTASPDPQAGAEEIILGLATFCISSTGLAAVPARNTNADKGGRAL